MNFGETDPIVSVGVDAGSTTTKLVGINQRGERIFERLVPTRPQLKMQVQEMLAGARAAGMAEGAPLIATGYGRKLVEGATRQITEISCHAKGVFWALKAAGTLIDVGGQDAKAIQIGADGSVVDFAMNDKCAAGTGRFLEVAASRLGLALPAFAALAIEPGPAASISSTCTVFAESEIISLIASGEDLPSIARGLHSSLMGRVASLARGLGVGARVYFSGGVARSEAARAALSRALEVEVQVTPAPQLMGAHGAALLGLKRA